MLILLSIRWPLDGIYCEPDDHHRSVEHVTIGVLIHWVFVMALRASCVNTIRYKTMERERRDNVLWSSCWLRPFSHLGSAIENIRRDRRARQSQGVPVYHTVRAA